MLLARFYDDLFKFWIFPITVITIASIIFLIQLRGFFKVRNSATLLWLGNMSYVIFLSHNYFTWKWRELTPYFSSHLYLGVAIVGATVVWTLLLGIINSRIERLEMARKVVSFFE